MGVIDRILTAPGLTAAGNAITGVTEVFRENETRRMELDEEAYARAIAQMGQEFQHAPDSWFDSFVNGLNRLPRPALTFGVLGLFVYAMIQPAGFAARMEGLQLVPEPLWWLLGAIVSFYFGAREAHYFRVRSLVGRKMTLKAAKSMATSAPYDADLPPSSTLASPVAPPADAFADNAALRDWAASLRR